MVICLVRAVMDAIPMTWLVMFVRQTAIGPNQPAVSLYEVYILSTSLKSYGNWLHQIA